jgi:hypothetical protein
MKIQMASGFTRTLPATSIDYYKQVEACVGAIRTTAGGSLAERWHCRGGSRIYGTGVKRLKNATHGGGAAQNLKIENSSANMCFPASRNKIPRLF